MKEGREGAGKEREHGVGREGREGERERERERERIIRPSEDRQSLRDKDKIPTSLTFCSRSTCLYFRVKKFRSAISSSVWRASRRRLMYLLTRVPGVV